MPDTHMIFNSPLHISKADRIITQFNLKLHSQVLDIGCGEGEFLIRVAEHYEINGIGLDINERLIEKAQSKASQRVKLGNVVFQTKDLSDFSNQSSSYDLIICIGSEFIFGGYEAALQKFKPLLTEKGLLLMGTIFWKQEPAKEYLHLMGGENPYFDHPTTLAKASQKGFIPLYVCRSNDDEWDDFESTVSQQKYLEALGSSSIPDVMQQIEKIKVWQNGYTKWGINTMGFGFYLLRNA